MQIRSVGPFRCLSFASMLVALPAQGPVRLLDDLNRFTEAAPSDPGRFALGGDFVYTDATGSDGRRYIVRFRADGTGSAQFVAELPATPTAGLSSQSPILAATAAGALFAKRVGADLELCFASADQGSVAGIASLAQYGVEACVVGEHIVYAVTTPGGTEVWTTTGTAASTQPVASLPGAGHTITPFARHVSATGEATAWITVRTQSDPVVVATDGTPAGTSSVTVAGLLTNPMTLADGRRTWAQVSGADIDIVAGATRSGPAVLRTLPGAASCVVTTLGTTGQQGWYSFRHPTGELELWGTDGSAAGTNQLLTVVGDSPRLRIGGVWQGSACVFSAPAYDAVTSIHAVDATSASASLLRSLTRFPRVLHDDPGRCGDRHAVALGERLLVRIEGWWYALAGDPAKDVIWQRPHAGVDNTAALDLSGSVVFVHTSLAAGAEPWVTDGTQGPGQLLFDLNPTRLEQQGTADSWPTDFRFVAGHTWMHATETGVGRRLVRSDGTQVGTGGIAGGALDGFGVSFELDGELWFVSDDDAVHRVTPTGQAEFVAALDPGLVGVLPFEHGFLAMLAGVADCRVLRWDGSSIAFAHVVPGVALSMPEPLWLGDRYAASYAGRLLLTGLDVENSLLVPSVVRPHGMLMFDGSLWAIDNLAPFAARLAEIDPLSGAVQLHALPPAANYRLCATPLALATISIAGMLVRDRAGNEATVPVVGEHQLAAFGDLFLLSDAAGTCTVDAQGQVVVLLPQSSASAPFLVANDREAYFQVGDVLWRTDGTPVGTAPHASGVPPIPETSTVSCVGGRLWFGADSDVVGVEPHSLQPRLAVETITRSCAVARAPRMHASLASPTMLSLRAVELAGSFATFFVSPPPLQTIAMPQCRVAVDLAGMEVLGPVSVHGGHAATALAIPNSHTLIGLVLHAQVASGPTDSWLGVDLTGGLRIEFGPH